ncbi:signal recognition particle-docking protein FtsY [Rhodobacterales bacterium HKCCA1058]|nr:signal recognition particle-docking protein FtsY [Rhodobacterales bacterium HKCCA1058]
MSFFKKMKERLFKSSSKIDEGLEALVAEGATDDTAPEIVEETAEAAERVSEGQKAPEPEPALEPEPQAEPEPEQSQDPEDAAEPAAVEEPHPQPVARPAIEGAKAEAAKAPKSAPEPVAKPSLLLRLVGGRAAPVAKRVIDDEMIEELEEILISADLGVETALALSSNLASEHFGRRMSVAEIKAALARDVARVMEAVAKPMPIYPKRPQVVLVVGVNGSGKTTTIGKLASQFKAAGKSVVIAACDTFRAAAVEQLEIWGNRAGVPVLRAETGGDPAALAFDAMARAEADGADLLLIDTAGRLQNRADLMEELAKIVRVIRKKDPDAPHNTLLVLDATTGQNALRQVEEFRKISDVSGLIMTKLDGTAKGGILVALADKFGLPIHAIGLGEQIDDLAPFDPEEFANALMGLERNV